jgi:type II secretory pathway pseudopilin PulG
LNSKRPWNQESGASLVAIMVSMALFGIVAVMAAQGFRNISFSGRRVEASVSAREIENVLLQAFVLKWKKYIEDGCPTGGAYFNNLVVGALADVSYRNVRFYNATHTATVQPPPAARNDLKRCNSTAFSNTAVPADSDTFYGCFDLRTLDSVRVNTQNNQLKASNDAFAANRGAFMEMYVKLRNLKTDQQALCTQMIKDRGFGLEVYYALHWTTPAGDTVIYDSKLGTFNANYQEE